VRKCFAGLSGGPLPTKQDNPAAIGNHAASTNGGACQFHVLVRHARGVGSGSNGKPPQSAQRASVLVNCARQRGHQALHDSSVGRGGASSFSILTFFDRRNCSISCCNVVRKNFSVDSTAASLPGQTGRAGERMSRRTRPARSRKASSLENTEATASGWKPDSNGRERTSRARIVVAGENRIVRKCMKRSSPDSG